MSQGISGLFHQIHLLMHGLRPLHSKKSPPLSFLIGFLFGPLGIGIYFRSFVDAFYSLLFIVSLTVIFPGIGVIPGWLLSAFYGAYRASTSNERLTE